MGWKGSAKHVSTRKRADCISPQITVVDLTNMYLRRTNFRICGEHCSRNFEQLRKLCIEANRDFANICHQYLGPLRLSIFAK